MKKIKRIGVAAMAAVMAATSLVACGGGGSDKKAETITLDVYSQLANSNGIQQGWFGALMKEKFNVELNIIPESGQTYSTLMEQGDLGDIVVWGSTGQQYQDAVAAGMLLDWEANGLLDSHGAYMKENMAAALENNRTISGTGKVYGFGFNVASSTDFQEFMYSWDLRYDYYDELGCPEIKNLDDLFDVFVAMKEKHPTDKDGKETYAISIWPDWDANMVMYPKSLASAYYGYDEFGLGHYNCETGEFYDALHVNDDGTYGPYLEMIQFFNKLYQNGLLDPNSASQTYNDATATISSGRTFWSIFNYAGSAVFNTQDHIAADQMMCTVVPEDANPILYGLSAIGGNRLWTIGAKTKYPDVCMDIINYLCTPKGFLTSEYGPEGLMWYYDENNKTHFTDLGLKCTTATDTIIESDDPQYAIYCGKSFKDGQQQINNITWARDAVNPETGEKYNYKKWASYIQEPAAGSIEAKWREATGAASADEYLANRNKYSLSIASAYKEGSKDADLAVVWKQVTGTIVDGSWKAIYAKDDAEFKSIVDDMIKEANAYDNGKGYDECVEWSKSEAVIRKQCEDEAIAAEKAK